MNSFGLLRGILMEIRLKWIILVTHFQKSPLIFDFGDMKLFDSAKLCFFKLIITKSNLKNQL